MNSPSLISSAGSTVSGSSGRSNVPIGIYAVVCLGLLGVFLALIDGLRMFSEGNALVGTVVIAFVAVEAVVLCGLLRLRPWAWILAVVLFVLGGILDALTFNLSGAVVSVGAVAYLVSAADKFD